MPDIVEGADVCWFALPITTTTKGDRAKLVPYLESKGIETRSMFAGNITKHPAYKNSKFIDKTTGESSRILRESFWIGVHPRMTQADREYVIKTFNDFFTTSHTHSSHK